jgi:archaellum component FlaC
MKKLDKLDTRLDKLETNIAVLGSILAQLQSDINKVENSNVQQISEVEKRNIKQVNDLEQQIKDLKARFWTMFTIFITTTAGFIAWAVQIILSK